MSDGNSLRSRLLGSSDHESILQENAFLLSGVLNSEENLNKLGNGSKQQQLVAQQQKFRHLNNYFSNNIFLDDEWHSEDYLYSGYDIDQRGNDSSWRLREKMRTVGLALVMCLNIGVDPPDVIKPNPCGRKECWFDPTGQRQKGLEIIGNLLQQQYEKYEKAQSKTKYKQCLDPTSEDLRKVLINLRKVSRNERLLFHYNGHGVPKPTKNGELWVFGRHYTHYTPVSVSDLKSWLGDPAIYVLDCSAAGLLIPHLVDTSAPIDQESMTNNYDMNHRVASPIPQSNSALSFISAQNPEGGTVVVAACKGSETLPFHPLYPADIFTACLTTPVTFAIRWFIINNPHSMADVNPDIAETIAGKDNDRNSPRGELNWILTAITDTIAWNILPPRKFQKLFRMDSLLASLFRNFLVAQRIMKSFRCTPQSWPTMPDSTVHPLWQAWDMALESFLTQYVATQRGTSMTGHKNNMAFNMPSNLTFFNDQLSAFEMWLEFNTSAAQSPPMLPVVLQVLLSKSHRVRVLTLLKKYLSLGSEAIRLSLILGIFPYVLKLLKNPSDDIKHLVISVWASIIGFDASCRQELVRDKVLISFIQGMNTTTISPQQRSLPVFVLAEVCNKFKEGQQSCLQLGLHRSCTSMLPNPDVMGCATLKLWTCLCLLKLCEDFMWAKYLCITEAGHTQLYPLLVDPDPTVRAAAILALGELFGASSLTNTVAAPMTPGGSSMLRSRSSFSGSSDDSRNGGVEEKDLKEAELQLALQVLECCTDGSVFVRLESVYALSKFFLQPAHIDCIKIVAKSVYLRNAQKKANAIAQKTDIRRSTSPSLEANSITRGNNSVYAWHLSPAESKEIASKLEDFIRGQSDQGGFSIAQSAEDRSLIYDSESESGPDKAASESEPAGQEKAAAAAAAVEAAPDICTLMAAAYIKLWLALTEVQGKDPHTLVAQAAADICFRVHALIAIDERDATKKTADIFAGGVDTDSSFSPTSLSSSADRGPYLFSGNQSPIISRSRQSGADQRYRFGEGIADSPGGVFEDGRLAPLGAPASASAIKAKSLKFGASLPKASPFLSASDSYLSSSYDNGPFVESVSGTGATTGNASTSKQSAMNRSSSKLNIQVELSKSPSSSGTDRQYFIEAFKDFSHLTEEDLMICFSSNLYETARRQFMEYGLVYDPFVDALSTESRNLSYRWSKLQDILYSTKHFREMFQDVEDRSESLYGYSDRKKPIGSNGLVTLGAAVDDSSNIPRSKSPSSMIPNNLCKFEQKTTLKIENPMTTTLLMFHAFQDILVVASGATASIWSLTNNAKILEVKNRHSMRGSMAEGAGTMTNASHKVNKAMSTGLTESSSPVNTNNSRITCMTWINESFDSLLLLGSDDGVVRLWRDVAGSDHFSSGSAGATPTPTAAGGTANASGSPNPVVPGNANIELVTTFSALPDIAETSRGSGVVLSWQQTAGTLVVGGNSSTIRVWDLGREQNVRVFNTGVETCLTAMATNTVANRFSSGTLSYPGQECSWQPDIDNTPVTWTFAGFADGSIAVYDERVHSSGGRVHFSHTQSGWVNYAHLRHDIPEVIVGSVRGSVKFWDMRAMRIYKTLEVQKSPITSLAVHNCAPIMATGSHAQFIKIITLGGEQLGNIIKYYDGFLGERIGPISSLAFHPHKLLLAASSVYGMISLYHSSVDKSPA